MVSIFALFFYSIPLAVIVAFIVSLCLFISAKVKNRAVPDTFSKSQITTRLVFLIVSSVFLGIIITVAIGLIALMYMAVAYM